VVVPSQQNILINPAHPRFEQALNTTRQEAFVFDPQLLKAS